MKKILLLIAIILVIFQMVVMATAIDIGSTVSDRGSRLYGNITYIDLANPADYTGKITSVSIWPVVLYSMASAKVATFYVSDGKYTARSASGDLGAIQSGAPRTFAVDLDVVVGDYIGIYFTDNADRLEADTSGGSGVVYLAGDQTACVNATFDLYADYAMSLHGTGATVFVPTYNFFGGYNIN